MRALAFTAVVLWASTAQAQGAATGAPSPDSAPQESGDVGPAPTGSQTPAQEAGEPAPNAADQPPAEGTAAPPAPVDAAPTASEPAAEAAREDSVAGDTATTPPDAAAPTEQLTPEEQAARDALLAAEAGAEQAAPAQEAGAAAPLPCEQRWGCWDLLHTTPGTVLGVRASFTFASPGKEPAGGFVATYFTEHVAAHEGVIVHFAAHGLLGAGSAGVEGGLGGALDFGFRAPVTSTAGPFLRAGMQGSFLANDALSVSSFEPLGARAGYQWLDGPKVLEAGLTSGFVPIARYQPGNSRMRDLGRSVELGGYASVRLHPMRGSASYMRLLSDDHGPRHDLDLARLSVCSYQLEATLCIDWMLIRGRAPDKDGALPMTHATYAGFTVGLSP